MTLASSGLISLGGTTAGRSAEKELLGNGTTQISMNDSIIRSLFNVGGSGTPISMSNVWVQQYL